MLIETDKGFPAPVASERLRSGVGHGDPPAELARWISKQLGCWQSATWGRCRGCVLLKWDQRFESAFLQRRVRCELPKIVSGGRVGTAGPPARFACLRMWAVR